MKVINIADIIIIMMYTLSKTVTFYKILNCHGVSDSQGDSNVTSTNSFPYMTTSHFLLFSSTMFTLTFI